MTLFPPSLALSPSLSLSHGSYKTREGRDLGREGAGMGVDISDLAVESSHNRDKPIKQEKERARESERLGGPALPHIPAPLLFASTGSAGDAINVWPRSAAGSLMRPEGGIRGYSRRSEEDCVDFKFPYSTARRNSTRGAGNG